MSESESLLGDSPSGWVSGYAHGGVEGEGACGQAPAMAHHIKPTMVAAGCTVHGSLPDRIEKGHVQLCLSAHG